MGLGAFHGTRLPKRPGSRATAKFDEMMGPEEPGPVRIDSKFYVGKLLTVGNA